MKIYQQLINVNNIYKISFEILNTFISLHFLQMSIF